MIKAIEDWTQKIIQLFKSAYGRRKQARFVVGIGRFDVWLGSFYTEWIQAKRQIDGSLPESEPNCGSHVGKNVEDDKPRKSRQLNKKRCILNG